MMQKDGIIELVKNDDWDALGSVVAEIKRSYKAIKSPSDIYSYLENYRAELQENFIVLLLNGHHEVIRVSEISKGLVNRCIVHPREVFVEAIRYRSTAIILAHNHPSGNTSPSPEDIDITKRLVLASEIIGIPVLDHIIIGFDKYFSMEVAGTVDFRRGGD